jgi:hypothetical protein
VSFDTHKVNIVRRKMFDSYIVNDQNVGTNEDGIIFLTFEKDTTNYRGTLVEN